MKKGIVACADMRHATTPLKTENPEFDSTEATLAASVLYVGIQAPGDARYDAILAVFVCHRASKPLRPICVFLPGFKAGD